MPPTTARKGAGLARLILGLGLLGLVGLLVTPTPAQQPRPAAGTFVHVSATKAQDVDEMSRTINTRLEAAWKANKVTPARFADDYEFIRRASLDIIGRIAKPTEIAKYLSDPEPTRRSLLIERLLASEEYPEHWADLWSNWLLSRAGAFGRGRYHQEMARYLKDQFAQNKSFDKMVKELLTAKGKNDAEGGGAVNFILAHVGEPVAMPRRPEEGFFEMVPITSRITRIFLGIQVQCAQCHDHPFSNAIKQKHFWGVNAFLRQVERVGNVQMQNQQTLMTLELKDNEAVAKRGKVFFEKRNGVVLETRAEFLPHGDEERGKKMTPEATGVTRRAELADALIDHPNFPKAIVNRMWGMFFGRGIINPIDDFNDNNVPTHPELFDDLAARFKHYNYDLKKLIRWMTHSKAYHLAAVANPTNDKVEHEVLFSRQIMKSMTPEQLYKSLEQATLGSNGTPERRDRWLNLLVTNFGDDEGNELTFSGTVVQALLLMNGNDLQGAITDPKGTVATLTKAGKRDDAIITELYLASLNRRPTPKELSSIQQKFALRPGVTDKDAAAKFQDLFWALLNSNEFILNH